MIKFSRILSHENDQIKTSKKKQAYIKLLSAGLIYDELIKLEKIEGRKDTNITVSLSRLDIQKTVVSPFDFELIDIHKSFDSVSSFRNTIYGGKEAGKPYKVYGETIKDKVRWKLRRYDKTFQILSEYSEDEKKIIFLKIPQC